MATRICRPGSKLLICVVQFHSAATRRHLSRSCRQSPMGEREHSEARFSAVKEMKCQLNGSFRGYHCGHWQERRFIICLPWHRCAFPFQRPLPSTMAKPTSLGCQGSSSSWTSWVREWDRGEEFVTPTLIIQLSCSVAHRRLYAQISVGRNREQTELTHRVRLRVFRRGQ